MTLFVDRKRRQQRTRSYSTLLPCIHGFHNVEGPQTGSSTDPTVNVDFRHIGSENIYKELD